MTGKIGICKDCPKGSNKVPLIAGRCNSHYWAYRASLSAKKKKAILTKHVKADANIFFASQILQAPARCECGCNQSIKFSLAWMQRATIAHILPKRKNGGCPSVATHPQNRCFLHPDCHNAVDSLGKNWLMKKPQLLQLMRDRVKLFYNDIAPSEMRYVPEYLIPEVI